MKIFFNTAIQYKPTQYSLVIFFLALFFANAVGAQTPYKVTYLFHSGWLIETASEVVMIDYIPSEDAKLDSVLFKKLNAAVEARKSAYILITHEHRDHFHQPLLQWHLRIKGLTTILGWNYQTKDHAIIKLEGRDSLKRSGLKIVAHPSTDIGSGFLVELNTLTIYHAGDHAEWSASMRRQHQNELQFIKSVGKKIDLAFFPIAQGKLGGCRVTESITNGTIEAIKTFQPGIVFPMHLQCTNLLPYKSFAETMQKKFPAVLFRYPLSNNQQFNFQ